MSATVKAYKGMGMEGSLAHWYDRTTRRDMPEYVELAERIASLAPSAGEVVEIAPGPGFLSIEMARRGLRVKAVEISQTFLEIAAGNAAREGVTVEWMAGDAAALPVEGASVDFVVCRAAFKNFSQPVKAMREMRRVLRPGGTALLIDMRREATVQDVRPYVERMGVGWWSRQSMTLIFKTLIRRAYPLQEIYRMAAAAGWGVDELEVTTASMGFEAKLQKRMM